MGDGPIGLVVSPSTGRTGLGGLIFDPDSGLSWKLGQISIGGSASAAKDAALLIAMALGGRHRGMKNSKHPKIIFKLPFQKRIFELER